MNKHIVLLPLACICMYWLSYSSSRRSLLQHALHTVRAAVLLTDDELEQGHSATADGLCASICFKDNQENDGASSQPCRACRQHLIVSHAHGTASALRAQAPRAYPHDIVIDIPSLSHLLIEHGHGEGWHVLFDVWREVAARDVDHVGACIRGCSIFKAADGVLTPELNIKGHALRVHVQGNHHVGKDWVLSQLIASWPWESEDDVIRLHTGIALKHIPPKEDLPRLVLLQTPASDRPIRWHERHDAILRDSEHVDVFASHVCVAASDVTLLVINELRRSDTRTVEQLLQQRDEMINERSSHGARGLDDVGVIVVHNLKDIRNWSDLQVVVQHDMGHVAALHCSSRTNVEEDNDHIGVVHDRVCSMLGAHAGHVWVSHSGRVVHVFLARASSVAMTSWNNNTLTALRSLLFHMTLLQAPAPRAVRPVRTVFQDVLQAATRLVANHVSAVGPLEDLQREYAKAQARASAAVVKDSRLFSMIGNLSAYRKVDNQPKVGHEGGHMYLQHVPTRSTMRLQLVRDTARVLDIVTSLHHDAADSPEHAAVVLADQKGAVQAYAVLVHTHGLGRLSCTWSSSGHELRVEATPTSMHLHHVEALMQSRGLALLDVITDTRVRRRTLNVSVHVPLEPSRRSIHEMQTLCKNADTSGWVVLTLTS